MPLPLIPIIAGAASVAGNVISNIGEKQYGKKMYERQRADSLADWHMQNEYNSPAAQMKRLKEGGLNPNLVYGNGVTTQAGPVRSAQQSGYSAKNVAEGVPNAMMMYYDTQLKEAQADKLKIAVDLAKQEILNSILRGEGMGIDNRMKSFTLSQAEKMAPLSLEGKQVEIDRGRANIKFTLSANERAELMTDKNLQMITENILNARAQRGLTEQQHRNLIQVLDNLRRDGTLKDFEIKLNQKGITKGDPMYSRILSGVLDRIENEAKKLKPDPNAGGKVLRLFDFINAF